MFTFLSFSYVFNFHMIFNFKSRLMVFLNLSQNYFEHARREAVDDIPESFSDMTFNHLRKVKIYNVTGVAAQMQFIKVLLAKSPTLVKMITKPCETEDKESFIVLAELTKFHRTSYKAEVVYSVDQNSYYDPV